MLGGAGLGNFNRVAFIQRWQAVYFVDKEVSRRDFGQVGRRAGSVDVEGGVAPEVFGLGGVALVAALLLADALAQLGNDADRLRDAGREALCEAIGGLQGQDVAGRPVYPRTDGVDGGLRLEHLRGDLGHHALAGVPRRQHLVNPPRVGRALESVLTGVRRAFWQLHELFGPLVDAQLRVGACALDGGAKDEGVAVV